MKYFYKINSNGVVSIGSGTIIPKNFVEYVKNKEPKELIDALSKQELLKRPSEINDAIQNHLDTKAQKFRYDNMMSARSYTGYTNAFQAEAQALATWASECWVAAGQIEADVQSGVRVMPTVDEVIAELPAYQGI